MSSRRALVVASQCAALQKLDFLPEVGQALYEVLIDPARGCCSPALERGGLVIDPSVRELDSIMREAFRRTARDDATLVLALIGHGEQWGSNFYYLPKDAVLPPTMGTAVYLSQVIKEELRSNRLGGLILLLDTCFAGVGTKEAAGLWMDDLSADIPFDFLAASSDEPAYDACFSRNLVSLIREGMPTVLGAYLDLSNTRVALANRCPRQIPQFLSFAAGADDGLYLSINAAASDGEEVWVRTALASSILALTESFQQTDALVAVCHFLVDLRATIIFAPSGAGKSTIVAALARPSVTNGIVPPCIIDALVFVHEGLSATEIATTMRTQLRHRFGRSFDDARLQFKSEVPQIEYANLSQMTRDVVGPLRLLKPRRPVRIAIDGWDRLAATAENSITEAVRAFSEDDELSFVSVLVTARTDTPFSLKSFRSYDLQRAGDDDLRRYLTRRGIYRDDLGAVIQRIDGYWLVAKLLADRLLETESVDLESIPITLSELYDEMLGRAGAGGDGAAGIIVALLASFGPGPVVPVGILGRTIHLMFFTGNEDFNDRLCPIKRELLRPLTTYSGLRSAFTRLRGAIARNSPGNENEHVGLIHGTLVDHIRRHRDWRYRFYREHGLSCLIVFMRDVIVRERYLDDPVGRFVRGNVINCVYDAVQVLPSKPAKTDSSASSDNGQGMMRGYVLSSLEHPPPDRREQLRIFDADVKKVLEILGKDDPASLALRSKVAELKEEFGCWSNALACELATLVRETLERYGATSPPTIRIRRLYGKYLREMGQATDACEVHEALAADLDREFGAEHPKTLSAMNSAAVSKAAAGRYDEALEILRRIHPRISRECGESSELSLLASYNVAVALHGGGRFEEAKQEWLRILPQLVRKYGADSDVCLQARAHVASCEESLGRHAVALELQASVVEDSKRVLGDSHPHTLAARHHLACLMGRLGRVREALQDLQELEAETGKIFGRNHSVTELVRKQISECNQVLESDGGRRLHGKSSLVSQDMLDG